MERWQAGCAYCHRGRDTGMRGATCISTIHQLKSTILDER